MGVKENKVNPMKAWLAEFLLVRGFYSGPEGKPLYSYQVTAEELKTLESLLRCNLAMAVDAVYRGNWAACYCLYVAERYRRYYDGGSGGWSWHEFDTLIDLAVSHQEKAKIVESGLVRYWKRNILVSDNGRDLLGSLFAEGGLPWQLVQTENHGFARAVRRGLKHMYSSSRSEQSVSDLLTMHEGELPQAFQTLQTRQLLAGIVTQLVDLAETPDLEGQTDAAVFLDQKDPEWRKAFPIPLDESNARTLVNDWLVFAGRSKKERKQIVEKSRWFTCDHYKVSNADELRLAAIIHLPQEKEFQVDRNLVNSTRFNVLLYEGDQLLTSVGVV